MLKTCLKRLENGAQLLALAMNSSECVSINVFYAAGSGDEAPGKSGVAHFLEHLSFKSTQDFAAGEFDSVLKALGAQNNACTSEDFTHYYAAAPRSALAPICAMLRSMGGRLAFSSAEFAAEKQVVLEEERLSVANSPFGRLWQSMHERAYEGAGALAATTIGRAREVAALSERDVMDFYERFYASENALIVLAGDVREEDVALAAEIFSGDWKQKPLHLPASAGAAGAAVAAGAGCAGETPTPRQNPLFSQNPEQTPTPRQNPLFSQTPAQIPTPSENPVFSQNRQSLLELAKQLKNPRAQQRKSAPSLAKTALFKEQFADLGNDIFAIRFVAPDAASQEFAHFKALARWLNLEHSSPLIERFCKSRAKCCDIEAYAHENRSEAWFMIFGTCCDENGCQTAEEIAQQLGEFLPQTPEQIALLNEFLALDEQMLLASPSALASFIGTAWAAGCASEAVRALKTRVSQAQINGCKDYLKNHLVCVLKENL